MTKEEAEEFTQAQEQIGRGWWRNILWAQKQGIPESLGLSVPQWAHRIGGYMRLSIEERREAVAELSAAGMSQRAIADVLGVNQATVHRDKDDVNASLFADEKPKNAANASLATFNQVNDNIGWAKWSWNPVTGCLHNCDYCYARDIANRFYPEKFEPTFHPERLDAPANTHVPKYAGDDPAWRRVFTCSMAD